MTQTEAINSTIQKLESLKSEENPTFVAYTFDGNTSNVTANGDGSDLGEIGEIILSGLLNNFDDATLEFLYVDHTSRK